MSNSSGFFFSTVTVAVVLLSTSQLYADADALVVQGMDGQLVTGRITNDLNFTEIPTRVFWEQFPSTYAWNNPGFHSLGAAPAGTTALPEGSHLEWDFLPMTIGDVTSNLFYWDGDGTSPADVEFGLPPGHDYSLTLFGRNNEAAAADGSPQFIPGATIDVVGSGSGLRLHSHRYFFLDDNDGLTSTSPADGIYLISMQLRMTGYVRSEPFFLVWGTLGVPQSTIENAAVEWVGTQLDSLATPWGDFDGDGTWGCGDVDLLHAQVVSESTDPMFDMNGDGIVTVADVTDGEEGWLAVAGGQNPDLTGGHPFLAGDANLDGLVDTADLDVWVTERFTAGGTWCDGDFNFDGTVDLADLHVWNQNKFTSSAGTNPIPEPSGWWLAIGSLGLLIRQSRFISR